MMVFTSLLVLPVLAWQMGVVLPVLGDRVRCSGSVYR
jgi:hypothetical protein